MKSLIREKRILVELKYFMKVCAISIGGGLLIEAAITFLPRLMKWISMFMWVSAIQG